MRNDLQIFENEEFGKVRTIIIDGESWFVGKDVATALGYKDTSDALKRHVQYDDKLTRYFTDSGQSREMYVVNESGLYALIFGSKLESAQRFKHWVTKEVLPSIHKTGSYRIKPTLDRSLTEQPGEVAKLINAVSRLMERQGSEPYKVTENARLLCEQYGIQVIEDFVKIPEYQQLKFFETANRELAMK